jgi:hypothetical protein
LASLLAAFPKSIDLNGLKAKHRPAGFQTCCFVLLHALMP